MRKNPSKGQSTVEYLLLVMAVVLMSYFIVMGKLTQDPDTGNITGVSLSTFEQRINTAYSMGVEGVSSKTQSTFDSFKNHPAAN